MRSDSVWGLSIADLLINLSAGWFGAVFIIPIATKLPKKLNLLLLTWNLFVGILSLTGAVELRKINGL